MTTLNRFEWLKAVMQADGLTPTAKNVASVIAVQFANDETGQANPSQRTLADYLKIHTDTVKRVLRELRNAGWLMAMGDGGRGKAPLLRLLAPGKIVPFCAPKRGGKSSPEREERGGNMCSKGGQIVPSHNKDKQSLEQKGRAPDVNRQVIIPTRLVPDTEPDRVAEWNAWLAENGYPSVQRLDIRSSQPGQVGYHLPFRFVPSTDEDLRTVHRFLERAVERQGHRRDWTLQGQGTRAS
jgi:hypothetical protein